MPEILLWLWYELWFWLLTVGLTLGLSYRMQGRRNVPRHRSGAVHRQPRKLY